MGASGELRPDIAARGEHLSPVHDAPRAVRAPAVRIRIDSPSPVLPPASAAASCGANHRQLTGGKPATAGTWRATTVVATGSLVAARCAPHGPVA